MSPEALRHSLLEMLTEQLIPAAEGVERLPLIFMEPCNLLRTKQPKTLHPGKPLQYERPTRSKLYLNKWPHAAVHAVRYPYLAAVVEGEIDWRIGIIEPASQYGDEVAGSDYMIVPVQAGTFFFMPPGVAYSDGSGFHWERAEPKTKEAIIFSMLVLPSGVMCHFCRSSADEHILHRQIFVSCPQVLPLTKLLEEELLQENCEDMIVRGHTQTILGYTRRALKQEIIVQPRRNDSVLYGSDAREEDSARNILDRARNHIEMNLRDELTPDSIALHVYISSRQLDRYFLRELGINIMEYVARRRIEIAKGLLRDTNLSVKQIGLLVGYGNPSSFVQVFKRRVGVSPGSFREAKEI